MLHSATRKKKLVDKCCKLGLSIYYNRVLQLSNKIANSVCNQYRAENLVCPPVLCKDLFTGAAADNIDYNLSSVTVQSSFHGTAVSLTQFSSSESSLACSAFSYSLKNASEEVSDIILPSSYSVLQPCILPSRSPSIHAVPFSFMQSDSTTVATMNGWKE